MLWWIETSFTFVCLFRCTISAQLSCKFCAWVELRVWFVSLQTSRLTLCQSYLRLWALSSPSPLLSSPPVLHRFASWPPATDDAEADVITASQHPWHSCTAIFPAFRLPDGQTDGRPSEHPAPILLFIRAAPRSSLHTTPSLPLFSNWRTAAEAEARRIIHVWLREGKWCCRLTKG